MFQSLNNPKEAPRSILALDFGGTKLAAAIVHFGEREWRSHKRMLSPADADAKADLANMRSLIHDLLQGEKPAAIGISFGGPVDAKLGKVRLSHHVPGWGNIPLREILEAEFQVPVSVDNDANVAALGEHRFGAGIGYESLFYITVSTGVGGGWILNGHPWRGAGGMAGEIGHVVVDPNGPICLCGKRGCVERLASGPYMAAAAREELHKQPLRGEILRSLANNNEDAITGQLISQAATQGDELALEILQRAGWALGVGIGNAANLINPQLFVLGGGVTKAGAQFWEVVRRVARETALPEVNFDIVPAALGDEAPLWGAVALAQEELN
ncbi:ROK family protein [Microcoleus sp. FACHB-831]|uniref:ROK family protein n=1 Tax=Microcoleus sp. FACHB-831 TaxID=2692827 RepID=UPI001681E82D|nr:ROK family protein [Microcoleus sp. FACHB-831]MBD1921357.1 ROK family protein [Microcoleus sp. FACHB-831]